MFCFLIKRFVLALLMSMIAWVSWTTVSQSASLTEYHVKAALLYKLSKFVEWPEIAFNNPTSPLMLCVIGEDPFGSFVDALENKTVRKRQVIIKRPSNLQDTKNSCHLVFVSASEEYQLNSIIKKLSQNPILSIGDTQNFAKQGGIINFVTKNNRIRFEINIDASKKAGLKISSQLLELATIVRTNP